MTLFSFSESKLKKVVEEAENVCVTVYAMYEQMEGMTVKLLCVELTYYYRPFDVKVTSGGKSEDEVSELNQTIVWLDKSDSGPLIASKVSLRND